MIIQKCSKLLGIILLILPIWTVSSQTSETETNESTTEFISTTNFPIEVKLLKEVNSVNYDEEISILKNQLSQCRAENKTQTDSALSTILRGIQKIQSNNGDNDLKLKEKDEIIACQKAQLEDKLKLLDIQQNEIKKANQQIADYKDQIKNLQSTIETNNYTINENNDKISKMQELNKNLNQFYKKVSNEAAEQYKQLETVKYELLQIQVNHTNYVKMRDENFKKYQSKQNSLLESCQKDLALHRKESTDKDATIKDLKENSYSEQLDECQRALEERSFYEQQLNDYRSCPYDLDNANANLNKTKHELSKCSAWKKLFWNKLAQKEIQFYACMDKLEEIPEILPESCLGLTAGVQEIQTPNDELLYARCDGDGWMIIQQRIDGSEDFNKDYREYEYGVGDVFSEFFMGLKYLHLITNATRHQLNVSITLSSHTFYAEYDDFRIGDEASSYELESIGNFKGNDNTNALQHHVKMPFSTYDKNCPEWATKMGGWWYSKDYNYCYLNAPFDGKIRWIWDDIRAVIMKIRPYHN